MRSQSVSWLLETAGMKVKTLKGGYKSWRKRARQVFSAPTPLVLIGGMTGSGKTLLLRALREEGEQVLDLEALAHHMGSAFGAIGQQPQPTSEQFSNEIASALLRFDPRRPIWVEAESRKIGFCHIPSEFFDQMKRAPLLAIHRSEEERLSLLEQMYGVGSEKQLSDAIQAIRDKLGGKRTAETLQLLQEGDVREAARRVLQYYDATYHYGLSKRTLTPESLDLRQLSWKQAARAVLDYWSQRKVSFWKVDS